jgi:hypothetical protein
MVKLGDVRLVLSGMQGGLYSQVARRIFGNREPISTADADVEPHGVRWIR